jgi:hypothetical protein
VSRSAAELWEEARAVALLNKSVQRVWVTGLNEEERALLVQEFHHFRDTVVRVTDEIREALATLQDASIRVLRDIESIVDGVQPMPCPGRDDVAAWVGADLEQMVDDPELVEALDADLDDRVQVGFHRYGTRLQTFNGRDFLVDAYQEALDLAMYTRGAILEQDGPGPDGAESQDELWDLYHLAWQAIVCARKMLRDRAEQVPPEGVQDGC